MLSQDIFNKEIQSIMEQLINVYAPEKVILFGSLAEGIVKEGTDIDLFIIKKDIPHLGVDRIRQLDSLIKYKLATDFIVYKPEEVRKRLEADEPFVKSIMEKGKVLYDGK